MLPYKNLIQLDRQAATPIFLQLTNQLVKLIQNGQLAPSAKLPSSRKLAALFQLNRNTVTRAIEELEALGWVTILPKKGTFVVDSFPIVRPQKWSGNPFHLKNKEVSKFDFYNFPTLQRPMAQTRMVGFDDGLPDIRLAPINELATAYGRNLRQLAFENDLSYQNGMGNYFLRTPIGENA